MARMFITVCILGLFLCGCGPETKIDTSESDQITKTYVYEVFGMDCPGCHGGLEKLVRKIPAVLDAKADWVNKKLTVTVRQGAELNDEDIFDAIRRGNFTPGKKGD